ncbi:MAG: DNA pilot protein [Microviridae sp.]|nr:MAG: DNA pilot protein [Microviridae sp.]
MPFGLDDLAFAGIASGALQGGSSLLGGIFGASGAQSTNAQQMAFNAQQAQQNRDWQEHMSNTAYQRAMADMRAAGLNPILAANLGGATTPGGSSASITGSANPGAAMGAGVAGAGSAAATAAMTKATLTQANKDQSQVDLNKSTTDYTKSNTDLNAKLQTKTEADTATSAANADAARAAAARDLSAAGNNAVTNEILRHNVSSAKSEADLKQLEVDSARNYGPGGWGHLGTTISRTIQNIGGGIYNNARDMVGVLKGEKVPGPPGSPPGTIIDVYPKRKGN